MEFNEILHVRHPPTQFLKKPDGWLEINRFSELTPDAQLAKQIRRGGQEFEADQLFSAALMGHLTLHGRHARLSGFRAGPR